NLRPGSAGLRQLRRTELSGAPRPRKCHPAGCTGIDGTRQGVGTADWLGIAGIEAAIAFTSLARSQLHPVGGVVTDAAAFPVEYFNGEGNVGGYLDQH